MFDLIKKWLGIAHTDKTHYRAKYVKITPEIKSDTIRYLRSGVSVKRIAKVVGISKSSVYRIREGVRLLENPL